MSACAHTLQQLFCSARVLFVLQSRGWEPPAATNGTNSKCIRIVPCSQRQKATHRHTHSSANALCVEYCIGLWKCAGPPENPLRRAYKATRPGTSVAFWECTSRPIALLSGEEWKDERERAASDPRSESEGRQTETGNCHSFAHIPVWVILRFWLSEKCAGIPRIGEIKEDHEICRSYSDIL